MSTSLLRADQVVTRAAALMNDPGQTDYTWDTVNPYLNMAIEELNEYLEESNVGITNEISPPIPVAAGIGNIINLPYDLIEIQEIGERSAGTKDAFVRLNRVEFIEEFPATNSLMYWAWQNQQVRFNPNGALTAREVQLKYVRRPFKSVQPDNGDTAIGTVLAMPFLSFKTAALCARFVAENPTRADALDKKADEALERIIGISNKGKQQIMTRHRPFRAGFKARGGY